MQHTIAPVYDNKSKVLILGSFPSVKSRDERFYYAHPQNRFWRVLAALLNCDVPDTIEKKQKCLLQNNIALWDVIESCDIDGSDDASIRNVIPNNLNRIIEIADIKRIFTNGGTADKFYRKYCLPQTGISATRLPSTSPANAGYRFDGLLEAWKTVANSLSER